MILSDFKAFPARGVLVGVDWGARRTGVAVSDAAREFVFARPVIVGRNSGDFITHILNLVAEVRAVGMVIGLPVRTDGAESETTIAVREFANALARETDLPIIFVDETLSSAAAQDSMGRVRRSDIKTKLDSESARVILENAIAIIGRNY